MRRVDEKPGGHFSTCRVADAGMYIDRSSLKLFCFVYRYALVMSQQGLSKQSVLGILAGRFFPAFLWNASAMHSHSGGGPVCPKGLCLPVAPQDSQHSTSKIAQGLMRPH